MIRTPCTIWLKTMSPNLGFELVLLVLGVDEHSISLRHGLFGRKRDVSKAEMDLAYKKSW